MKRVKRFQSGFAAFALMVSWLIWVSPSLAQETKQEDLLLIAQEQSRKIERLEKRVDELMEEQNRLLQEVDRNRTWLG